MSNNKTKMKIQSNRRLMSIAVALMLCQSTQQIKQICKGNKELQEKIMQDVGAPDPVETPKHTEAVIEEDEDSG